MDICMLVAIADRLVRIGIIILLNVLNVNPYFDPPLSLPTPLLSSQKWCTLIQPYMQMKHQTRVYFMFSKMRMFMFTSEYEWVHRISKYTL